MNAGIRKLRSPSLLHISLCAGLPLLLSGQTAVPNHPAVADGQGVFATGHYRNRFAEDGHSEAEVLKRLQAAFGQFFHCDPSTQSIYFESGVNETASSPTSLTGLITTSAPKG